MIITLVSCFHISTFHILNFEFQDPRVLDAMLPYMTNFYGNPHSRTHAYGWESEKAVEVAREVNIYNILDRY